MKCINKAFLIIGMALIAVLLTGCGGSGYSMKFDRDMESSAYTMVNSAQVNSELTGYSQSICVDNGDYAASFDLIQADSGALFNTTNLTVLYGKNMYDTMNPASTTKIMTALVALKYGNLDDRITVTENAMVTESGAQTAGLRPGDTMTLEQALNIMLVCSANDAALAVAEHVGGSVDTFVKAMNAEAYALGATNTHFCNPHGLTEEGHLTTAYDMYLIFNEALKIDEFKNIIGQVAYTTSFYDATGNVKEIEVGSTNLFFKDSYNLPPDVVVLGGKTGTTAAAGSCLVMYEKDSDNKYYITVILHAPDRESSYTDTSAMLAIHD